MPVPLRAMIACPRCGRPASAEDLSCSLCGEVLRRERSPGAAAPPGAAVLAGEPRPARGVPLEGEDETILGLPPRWFVLLAGVLLAPVLTWTPLLRYMGWFLASLVHETGHTAVAWLLGCPAFPGIRLDGHAAAVHREQVALLAVAWMAGLAGLAWTWRKRPPRLALAIAALAVYPALAFTGAREGAFLLAGHLGEIAFAAYALVQSVHGGFTGTLAERCAHAGVGWYLLARDATLAWGLATSAAARGRYAQNGSFGLENDLVRFARDVVHRPLPTVAWGVLVLALLPVVWVLFRTVRPAEPP